MPANLPRAFARPRPVPFPQSLATAGSVTMIALETASSTIPSGSVTYTLNQTVNWFKVDGWPVVIDPGGLTILSRTPAETTTASKVINTTIKNPQRLPNGSSEQGWDERMPGTWNGSLKASFPLSVAANDIVIGAIGRTGASASLTTPVQEYCPIYFVSGQKPVGSVLPASIGWTGRGAPTWYTMDADTLAASLPTYATAGMTLPTYATILSKLSRWETAWGRQADAASGSDYEQEFTDAMSVASGNVNYGQYVGSLVGVAGLMLISNGYTTNQKSALLRQLVRIGVECYDPVAGLGNPMTKGNGGHFQFRTLPMMVMGWALGRTSVLDNMHTVAPENTFLQPFIFDAAKIADLAVHSSATKPYFARRRTISAVSGNDITVPYSGGAGGDPASNVVTFNKIKIVRESDGKFAIGVSTTTPASDTIITIDAQPSPAFAISDVVYGQSIDPIVEGVADWGLSNTTDRWNDYNPSAVATYRQQNFWTEEVLVSQALGIHRSAWDALRDYTIRANEGNEPAALRDFNWHHDSVVVDTTPRFAREMWVAHAPTIITGKPGFISKPQITGTLADGVTLGIDLGTVAGSATITYAYQWYLDGAAVGGATSSTYVVQTADVGKVPSCRVTATNGSGSTVAFANAEDVIESAFVARLIQFDAADLIQSVPPNYAFIPGGTKMAFGCSFHVPAAWSTGTWVAAYDEAGNIRFRLYAASSSRIGVQWYDKAGTTIVSTISNAGAVTNATSYDLFAECDTGTGVFRARVRPHGGSWGTVAGWPTTCTTSLTAAYCTRFAAGGIGQVIHLGDIWLDNNLTALPDISQTATQNKCRSIDSKGASGEKISGKPPAVFCGGTVANWHINKGTGGGIVLSSGTLSDSGLTPS